MPLYSIRICENQSPTAAESNFELADSTDAWAELTGVCGDLIKDVARAMKPDASWHVDLLDESKTPLFRIKLLSERLG